MRQTFPAREPSRAPSYPRKPLARRPTSSCDRTRRLPARNFSPARRAVLREQPQIYGVSAGGSALRQKNRGRCGGQPGHRGAGPRRVPRGDSRPERAEIRPPSGPSRRPPPPGESFPSSARLARPSLARAPPPEAARAPPLLNE